MESSVLNYKVKVPTKRFIPGAIFGPFSFINILSGKEIMDAENGMKNMVEVAVALRIVQLLYKERASSKHKITIAVLSAFPAQVNCIQQKLENHFQNTKNFNVKAGFLNNYEDGEVDVMIISTVGADGDKCIELNRTQLNSINACLALARHCLWILGEEKVHLKGNSMWESLIVDAKADKCFFQADEHKDLAKVILEVTKDIHQLDELLSGESTKLFQSTTWKVLFSGKFRTSFSKIESWETKKLVLLMLLKLSTGWRQKRSSTASSVCQSPYFELMREFKVRGLHLICTIDIVKETHYTQVLKVWEILPFHDIDELVTRLEGIYGMYTQDYIDRCKTRHAQRGGFEFPWNWPLTSEIIQYKNQANDSDEMFIHDISGKRGHENVKVRESLVLMKFYPMSSGAVNNMISGCDGGELALPFELTEQENDVVSFDKSSFILGRSGTGKTTVLTMKLLQNEQLHHLACEGFHDVVESNKEAKQDALHQLFVTLSPKLCYAVKQHVGQLKRLTCHGRSSASDSCSVSIDEIDKMLMSEDIQDHFVNLPHDRYPLIITFHRFLLMLDGTVGTSFFERFSCVRKLICGNSSSTSRLIVLEEYMRSNDVTYERFCSSYWPHFNNEMTKNLDPSTVYTEIMSVIKGGLTSGNSCDGSISRLDYVRLCDARTSIFDGEKRQILYSIFLQYEKKKVEKRNFDLADLVNDLHQRLEVEGYKGDLMDYVYIDEVQDLSMRQIMLFKYVCTNVHEGFSFSGDTAQAIAKGIGFRFEDIRFLFFSKFLLGSNKGRISKVFQLSENFRTHAGILNLAQSVINLLCHFFPLFVDALRPETSRIGGELPILLETDTNSNAIKTIFGRIGDGCQQVTGFGAEQVVLVRDEYLKEKVVNAVGKNALVLTIMESKGLEFQDVLLYDFFTTSSFSNEWRIIYEYMKEKTLLNSASTLTCSCFDMEKHTVICSELKQLYVAITRTRQRLWICETAGCSQPIFDYWKKLNLVEVKHLNDSFADKMQIPSSKDEWRSRGVKLFYENNFRMAQTCFLKAGDMYSERLAEAHQLRVTADGAHTSQLERKKLLKDAAEIYHSLGKNELAAKCFFETEDYRTAGDIYLSESMLEEAGNCFCLAKCYELAVEVYEKAGAIANCLSACADGKLFETGLQLIGRWGGCGGAEFKFYHKGARYYFGIKDLKSMMKFVRSFCSKDDMRSFLNKKRCLDEWILLEREWGNFDEAAKVARLKSDPLLEADLLHMGGLHKESSLIILWHVFFNSSILQNTDEPFTQKEELIMKAVSIAKNESVYFHQFVCEEARILSEGKTEEELLQKSLEFIYCYKNAFAVSLERVKTTQEIENIEKDLFNRMRCYLKSLNCLDELLLLEEVRGEFVAAAKIGKGDDCSIEAALSRLWYVFFGSLWAQGKRAWPLKDFKQKGKLLDDVKSYGEKLTDSQDSALVLTELSILSSTEISLCDGWRYMSEIPRERSLRIHFLISRRILDVHLDSSSMVYACNGIWNEGGTVKHLKGVLSEDIVSVEGLIYFWGYWKDLIRELIKWSCKMGAGGIDSNIFKDFILNYFGVRKSDSVKKGSYVMLDAEAQWVREKSPVILKNGYLHIIGASSFSSVATQYWCSELLFVAEKVLRKLQSLHAYSTVKNFSMYQQTKILTSSFEIAKSLQICKLPYSLPRATRIVHQSFQECVNTFLCNVFHINWKLAQSKEMILLRGNETFLNMLEEGININSKSQKRLSMQQLGTIAMILLGSKKIGFNVNTTSKLREGSSPNWRDLIDKLNSDGSSSKNMDLAISLHNVLKETFSGGWQRVNDSISPSCFLYLMERLLILSFCFHGYVYTTRSSCIEWLAYEEWGLGSNRGCVTCLDTMNNIHYSLASMVYEILNSQMDLLEWVARSKEESSYATLVLRLTVLLSLICANLGRHYYHLFDLLRHPHIVSLLPSKFREALIIGIKEGSFVDGVAAAGEKIDNPLVMVSFTKYLTKSPCKNAVFLNMTELDSSRETLIEMLYQESESPF